jgi:hypothetical protein
VSAAWAAATTSTPTAVIRSRTVVRVIVIPP